MSRCRGVLAIRHRGPQDSIQRIVGDRNSTQKLREPPKAHRFMALDGFCGHVCLIANMAIMAIIWAILALLWRLHVPPNRDGG